MNLYVLLGASVGSLLLLAGAYTKGRLDEKEHIQLVQMKEYQKAVDLETAAREARAKSDSDARLAAEKFISNVHRQLGKVRDDFKDLPMVTVGSTGCLDINDNFRLRWNSAEVAAAGATQPTSGDTDGTLQGGGLPDAGGLREAGPRD